MTEPKPEDREKPTPSEAVYLAALVRRTSLANVLAALRDVAADEACRFAEESDAIPMSQEAEEFGALTLRWFRSADRIRTALLFVMRQNV